jgi:hypothetical protein
MTPPVTSTWYRRRERFSMVIAVVLILNFHYLLFYFARRYHTTHELYLHSLLLLTLPGLIGSLQNLRQYQRWASYYFICNALSYVLCCWFFFCFARLFLYSGLCDGNHSVVYLITPFSLSLRSPYYIYLIHSQGSRYEVGLDYLSLSVSSSSPSLSSSPAITLTHSLDNP